MDTDWFLQEPITLNVSRPSSSTWKVMTALCCWGLLATFTFTCGFNQWIGRWGPCALDANCQNLSLKWEFIIGRKMSKCPWVHHILLLPPTETSRLGFRLIGDSSLTVGVTVSINSCLLWCQLDSSCPWINLGATRDRARKTSPRNRDTTRYSTSSAVNQRYYSDTFICRRTGQIDLLIHTQSVSVFTSVISM